MKRFWAAIGLTAGLAVVVATGLPCSQSPQNGDHALDQ